MWYLQYKRMPINISKKNHIERASHQKKDPNRRPSTRLKLDDPSSDTTDQSSRTRNPSLQNELHNRSWARKEEKTMESTQYIKVKVVLWILALLYLCAYTLTIHNLQYHLTIFHRVLVSNSHQVSSHQAQTTIFSFFFFFLAQIENSIVKRTQNTTNPGKPAQPEWKSKLQTLLQCSSTNP